MNKHVIRGIFPAVTTAYADDGSIDEGRLAALCDCLLGKGANGLFIGGSTSEWPLLTINERKSTLEAALEGVKGKSPVVMHTSSLIPSEVLDLSAHAAACGAAAVSIVMPSYYQYDETGLMRYFDRIIPKLSLPVYLYNIPGNVKNPLTPHLFERMANTYEMLCGVKDSSMDFLRLQEFISVAKRYDLDVLTGNDAQILPCLLWGGVGAISAAAGVFPEVAAELYADYLACEQQKAMQLQENLMHYRAFVVSHPALSVVKGALAIRGVDMGGLRPPLRELEDEEMEALKRLVIKISFPTTSLIQ